MSEKRFFWITLEAPSRSRETSPFREYYAINALPFTWLRLRHKLLKLEASAYRAARSPSSFAAFVAFPEYPMLVDFKEIPEALYLDAAGDFGAAPGDSMAWPVEDLEDEIAEMLSA